MDEARINKLMGQVATLRDEIAHAAREYAKVGGDPKTVGVTAAEVASGLEEAVREIGRLRLGIARMRKSAEVAMAAHGEVGNILDTLSRGGYVDKTGAEVVELENEDERPASSKTEPAPPLDEELPHECAPENPEQMPHAPADVAGHALAPSAETVVLQVITTTVDGPKPDPTDPTVAGRRRAAEAERTAAEWEPDPGQYKDYDPAWLKGEALARFRSTVDPNEKKQRWGKAFNEFLRKMPEDDKRKAVE